METIESIKSRIFTTKAEADKAINCLKGLLEGINLDGEVNVAEVDELVEWSRQHKHLIQRNPFNEFMTIIAESVKQHIPNMEVIQDLYWLCQKYEVDNYLVL